MKQSDRGFSTVELVVTLFVATMFIFSGYQLFGVITARSGESRQLSLASNIGYEVLRSKGEVGIGSITTPCSGSVTSIPVTDVSTTTLPSAAVSMTKCKPYSDLSVIKVTSIVEYGDTTPKKKVVHATYFTP
ncbi:hypothetical protein EOM60_02235 [Candidatus Saccharibacteria bacterium]|nr:hypothetical protein [Candidatus Saccharibacteria bacterium]